MIDPEFKAKWLEALRGDKYQQCRTELTDCYGFCCIGVGYEVSGKDCKSLQGLDDPTEFAAKDIGLPHDHMKTLIAMNDGTLNKQPKSFAEIADYIEANL